MSGTERLGVELRPLTMKYIADLLGVCSNALFNVPTVGCVTASTQPTPSTLLNTGGPCQRQRLEPMRAEGWLLQRLQLALTHGGRTRVDGSDPRRLRLQTESSDVSMPR